MDDHLYNKVMAYAECDLIPRFKREYRKVGIMGRCSSYEEIKALCVALNAIAPYAGYSKVTPRNFIE